MAEYLFDLILFVLAALLLHQWRKYNNNSSLKPNSSNTTRNLPPGPPGWPLIGNLGQVVLQHRPFMHIVRDLRQKYGPIFTMKMGQRTLVIVTSSDLIHEALVQKGAAFASRPADSPIRLIFSVGKCAINSAEYGPLWRALRRNFVTEMVSPAKVKQSGWVRDWALGNHMRKLRAEAEASGFVEVMSFCRMTVCSILICLCFGARISDERVAEIESVLKEVMLMTTLKLPDFLPVLTPLFRLEVAAAKRLRERQMGCLVPLIRRRRLFLGKGGTHDGEMASQPGAAYIDSLFKLEPPGRGRLGEAELVTLVSEIINAGTDTSATTTEWALLHLVQDQQIQEKLYKEIVDRVGLSGSVQESDVEQMVYLNAVVKETLRRHPPSHFLLSHAAVENTELAGYTVPAGVNVEFYTAWVTEDPESWADPGAFRPERFLTGDGVGVDLTGTKGVKMAPFGVGRRICPAFSLGMLHVNLMLARMVHAFRWVPVSGCPPDPTETFAFTVVMKNPLKAVIIPRV
uniref:Cytochrome P450 n=1 Tax=Kalanchoe fedtschenkoi TaxID=63787 RepID=A0A7N0TS06_KALFE